MLARFTTWITGPKMIDVWKRTAKTFVQCFGGVITAAMAAHHALDASMLGAAIAGGFGAAAAFLWNALVHTP